ncbi:MAG: ATP-binding SpoIIE family protein phosphatase [Pseudomonadota bacterium]
MSLPEMRRAPESATASGVVLVVDDNTINRTVLQEQLQLDGYVVHTAADGAAAIRVFEARPVDFVLMDVMMPGMDGYAATRRIKEICGERDQYCPVLFVTAMTDEQSLAACVECGGDGFLVKPYNRTILRAKMNALERTRDLYALVRRQKGELELHHDHLRREHDIAERTVNQLMQNSCLDAPNLRYLLAPLGLASGDLLLAEYRPDGVQQVLLGDFTGHGLAAAMGAIPVADIFLSMTRKGFGIDEIAAEINRNLHAKLPVGLFLAACMLALDHRSGRVDAWNGGVPDVLIRRRAAGDCVRLSSRHLPLGILAEADFAAALETARVEAGDRIYVYSDGLIEAIGPAGEMFGEARLAALLARPAAAGHFPDICAALHAFRGDRPQNDDVALMEIECGPAAAPAAAMPEDALTVSLDYTPRRLREELPERLLTALLEALPALAGHRRRLYTVVTELFSNALDHGLLQLDSAFKRDAQGFADYYARRDERLRRLAHGSIRVTLRLSGGAQAGRVDIAVEDSGTGFDHAAVLAAACGRGFARRGLSLVRELCAELRFRGKGNRVEAAYVWPRPE